MALTVKKVQNWILDKIRSHKQPEPPKAEPPKPRQSAIADIMAQQEAREARLNAMLKTQAQAMVHIGRFDNVNDAVDHLRHMDARGHATIADSMIADGRIIVDRIGAFPQIVEISPPSAPETPVEGYTPATGKEAVW